MEDFQKKYGRLPTEKDPDWLKELERAKTVSKLRILNSPIMAPGKCVGCGAIRVGDRKYIDTGESVEYYGVIYICSKCIETAAVLIGLYIPRSKHNEPLPVADLVDIRNSIDSYSDNIASLMSRVLELQEQIDERLGVRSSDNSSDPAVAVNDPMVSMEKSTAEHSGSGVEGTEQGSSEQNSSNGPENIPSLSSILSIGSQK